MDPLTRLSAVIGDVSQYSYTQSYRFENNQFLESDLQIYSKLDVERERTRACVNGVRAIDQGKLRATFPSKEYNRMLDAWKSLRQNYEQASRKLESVDQGKSRLPEPFNDDLKKLLSNLTAANNFLQPIAFAPKVPQAMDSLLNRDSIRPSFIPPVRVIYRTTQSTLVAISVRLSDSKIARSASRLKLWGTGLFEMVLPLDTVFDSNRDAFQPVRQCVLRILVDILVWEEQELNKLSNDDHNKERRRDSQYAEQITALLGTDELIPMALESWKDSVDQHEYVRAGGASTNYNPVPGLVEILFDLLPALRATRRTYCSRLAEAESLEDQKAIALLHHPAALPSVGGAPSTSGVLRRSASNTRTTSVKQPKFDESYVDLADSKFDQAVGILEKLDKVANKMGRPAYTPKLRSERESLGKFHFYRKMREDVNASVLEDIFAKQVQLVENLTEFIAESSDVSNSSGRLKFLKRRQRQGKYLDRDFQRADAFLSFLNSTNRAMRRIMQ